MDHVGDGTATATGAVRLFILRAVAGEDFGTRALLGPSNDACWSHSGTIWGRGTSIHMPNMHNRLY